MILNDPDFILNDSDLILNESDLILNDSDLILNDSTRQILNLLTLVHIIIWEKISKKNLFIVISFIKYTVHVQNMQFRKCTYVIMVLWELGLFG